MDAGLVFIALLISGCAPLRTLAWAGRLTPPVPVAASAALTTSGGTAAESVTAEPFALELTPLPTETALPALVLPTEAAQPSGIQVWDGLPTYPAESRPDFYFRLHYDPALWAHTRDAYGFPALAHRGIPDCVIAPAAGRGLPLNGSVDHEVRKLGTVNFQISTAYVNGIKQFVSYAGGDGNIYTGFEVSFGDQVDRCLADAEAVLATLGAVPILQATAVATP